MRSNTIKLTITNTQDIILIFNTLAHLEKRSGYHFSAMRQAVGELVENVLQHAYHVDHNTPIHLSLSYTIKACRLEITLQEFGEPFDFTPYLSEALQQSNDHSKGFYLIYDLVDTFYFSNLGNDGKQFTLRTHLSSCQNLDKEALPSKSIQTYEAKKVKVDPYQLGDEVAISKLIYQNYDYTYYKPIFYRPLELKVANISQRVVSFLARYEQEIIGHFALVPRRDTNSGEVAVAIVHPQFKGMGVMHKMFNKLIEAAQKERFRSIFGEAIMLHPYSQKANLKQGMRETAIVLGLVPKEIEIEHQLKLEKRSGVLLGYLLFEHTHIKINTPSIYQKQIEKTYQPFDLSLKRLPHREDVVPIKTYTDSELNLGTICLDADVSLDLLTTTIERMMLEHHAMLYVDINLHRIKEIDGLVEALNQHGFFYCGVLFDFYHNEDYLRVQKVTSKEIDTDHLVTYSSFAQALLEYIRLDKKRIGF